MKFGKEFASQMVPKWQEAYMDYSYLKAVLKDVLNIRKRVQTVSPKASTPGGSALKRGVSLHRAFSGITSRHRRNPNSPLARGGDEEVLFNSVRENGSSSGARNQTTFLMSSEEGGECELVFFRRLNDEFNKVVMLYRKKVQEVVEEADELTRQMNAHVRFQARNHAGVSELELPQDCTANLLGSKKQGTATMAAIQEGEMSGEEQVEGESRGSTENPTSPSAGRVEEIGGENDAGICRVLPKASASEELLLPESTGILQNHEEVRQGSFFGCMLALIAAIVVVVIIITFLPFNIIYRSSWFFLIGCAFHCICVPLYKVTLPDFFLVNQLTSQVQSFRDISFYICYYSWGDFTKCEHNKVHEFFFFTIAIIPFWYCDNDTYFYHSLLWIFKQYHQSKICIFSGWRISTLTMLASTGLSSQYPSLFNTTTTMT
ncbi:hypothetical protein CRG98_031688 [Punica granatum]|uniref:SPX domain-containing protein n=1 Tax=Punica granatum TaxID=22663 RepID=A0A2I0IV88_PUNGR|nr:hypothetical protein CRG98_031688 [Punica granatum]